MKQLFFVPSFEDIFRISFSNHFTGNSCINLRVFEFRRGEFGCARNQTYSSYFIHTYLAFKRVRMVGVSDLGTLPWGLAYPARCTARQQPLPLWRSRRGPELQGTSSRPDFISPFYPTDWLSTFSKTETLPPFLRTLSILYRGHKNLSFLFLFHFLSFFHQRMLRRVAGRNSWDRVYPRTEVLPQFPEAQPSLSRSRNTRSDRTRSEPHSLWHLCSIRTTWSWSRRGWILIPHDTPPRQS